MNKISNSRFHSDHAENQSVVVKAMHSHIKIRRFFFRLVTSFQMNTFFSRSFVIFVLTKKNDVSLMSLTLCRWSFIEVNERHTFLLYLYQKLSWLIFFVRYKYQTNSTWSIKSKIVGITHVHIWLFVLSIVCVDYVARIFDDIFPVNSFRLCLKVNHKKEKKNHLKNHMTDFDQITVSGNHFGIFLYTESHKSD